MGTVVPFQWVKWPERDVHLTPLSSAEIKEEWSYTSILFVCPLGVEGDNFTLTDG